MKANKILKDLISIDSQTYKSNVDIISYIQNYFRDAQKFSYNVDNIEMNNLVAKFEGKVKKRKEKPLIFILHTDTIEIQEGWITNPLRPYQKENKIYGLGAGDMKGSIACLIAASINCKPLRDIYLVFVGSEEDNSQGSRNLLEKVKFPRSEIIVAEPTNRLIYLSQRGYLEGVINGQKIQKHFDPNERRIFLEKENKLMKSGRVIYSNPPNRTSKESRLVKMIHSLEPIIKISNNPFAGWTEAGLFNKFGDAIIFGAGNYDRCHKPNENIDLSDLEYFTNVFSKIINYKN